MSALVRASGFLLRRHGRGCREESAPQQTIIDGALLDLSFALSLFERAGHFKGRQLFRVGLPALEPCAGGGRELGGEVDRLNVDKAGRREQLPLIAAGRNRPRTRALGAPTLCRRQVRSDEDRRVGDPTSRAEQPAKRSQHGELSAQSTQDIGEHDRIERLASEWLLGTARRDKGNPILDVLSLRATACSGERAQRHVGTDQRTAGARREVQAGPAAPGSHVEQTPAWREIELAAELVGLIDSGVAVRSPHGADD